MTFIFGHTDLFLVSGDEDDGHESDGEHPDEEEVDKSDPLSENLWENKSGQDNKFFENLRVNKNTRD